MQLYIDTHWRRYRVAMDRWGRTCSCLSQPSCRKERPSRLRGASIVLSYKGKIRRRAPPLAPMRTAQISSAPSNYRQWSSAFGKLNWSAKKDQNLQQLQVLSRFAQTSPRHSRGSQSHLKPSEESEATNSNHADQPRTANPGQPRILFPGARDEKRKNHQISLSLPGFAHFKPHRRANLSAGGTERPGLSDTPP